jgi:energy-coupling factor transporter ATP-binding protein EcfA2
VGPHFSAAPEEALAMLGFTPEVLAWEVSRLSSGERQRLALLRLMAQQPEVLLLDEPTANLDADSAGRVESLLARYRSETGAALIWVGHDPAQLRRVADRVFTLADGRLIQDGPPF